MSNLPESARQFLNITPPRSNTVTVANVTSTSSVINLVAKGYQNRTIEIHAESNAIYVLVENTANVVANASAYSGNTQCVRIPVDGTMRIRPKWNVDTHLAVVCLGSNTATVRIFPNSEKTIEQGNRLG